METFTRQELIYLARGMRVLALEAEAKAKVVTGPSRDVSEFAARAYRELERKCEELAKRG
jgi:hypothetical protein